MFFNTAQKLLSRSLFYMPKASYHISAHEHCVNKENKICASIFRGNVDRNRGESLALYQQRSLQNDLLSLLNPYYSGSNILILYAKATCFFEKIDKNQQPYTEVVGGHASGVLAKVVDDKILVDSRSVISKVPGKIISRRGDSLLRNNRLRGQSYVSEAVYEDESNKDFHLFSGSGLSTVKKVVIPEMCIILDADFFNINCENLVASRDNAKRDTYDRMNDSCGNFVLEVITEEPYSAPVSTHQAIRDAGSHIIQLQGDTVLEKAYNRVVAKLGFNNTALQMAALGHTMFESCYESPESNQPGRILS